MKKKWLIIGAIALVVLLFVGLLASRINQKKQREAAIKSKVPPPPAVTVAHPHKGRMVETLKLPGTVVTKQQVQLVPKVAGRLTVLRVDEGSPVRVGQVLGEIEHTELDAQLLQARAAAQASKANLDQLVNGPLKTQIAQARASVGQLEASLAQLEVNAGQSERDLQRQQTLVNEGAATQQQLEMSRTQLEAARQQIAAMRQQILGARANLQQLLEGNRPEQIDAARAQYQQSLASIKLYQAQLRNYQLISPLNGVVTDRALDPGSYVGPPAAILTLAESGRPEIEINLPERNLAQVHSGQDVEVNAPGMSQTLHAVIVRVAPIVNPTTRLIKLTAVLTAPYPLRSGMLLDCSIVLQAKAGALTVPAEAVIMSGNRASVYVAANNKVEERQVQLGLRTPAEIEIKSGLKPADQVIVNGVTYVRPGDKIQIQPALKQESQSGT